MQHLSGYDWTQEAKQVGVRQQAVRRCKASQSRWGDGKRRHRAGGATVKGVTEQVVRRCKAPQSGRCDGAQLTTIVLHCVGVFREDCCQLWNLEHANVTQVTFVDRQIVT